MIINNKNYIKRFEANLKIYNEENGTNYTFEDVQDKFIDVRELTKKTTIEDENYTPMKCMCDHKIYKLFEIINPDNGDTMILGSDCIETYMIKSLSKCKICNKRFKFNPNCKNRCNDCKKIKIKCKRCNKIKKVRKYKKKIFINCKNCKKELEEEKAREEEKKKYNKYCIDCGKFSSKYIRCYKCNLNKINIEKYNYSIK